MSIGRYMVRRKSRHNKVQPVSSGLSPSCLDKRLPHLVVRRVVYLRHVHIAHHAPWFRQALQKRSSSTRTVQQQRHVEKNVQNVLLAKRTPTTVHSAGKLVLLTRNGERSLHRLLPRELDDKAVHARELQTSFQLQPVACGSEHRTQTHCVCRLSKTTPFAAAEAQKDSISTSKVSKPQHTRTEGSYLISRNPCSNNDAPYVTKEREVPRHTHTLVLASRKHNPTKQNRELPACKRERIQSITHLSQATVAHLGPFIR